MAGTRKARVLPVPVLALTKRSLGAAGVEGGEEGAVASPGRRGNTFDWTGDMLTRLNGF
jgi:hypothetical protein